MVEIITNRYRVEQAIGSGAMGTVYQVYDRLTAQVVALKRVTHSLEAIAGISSTAQFDYRLALTQEFKTMASLRHPNIISVLDYGFDDTHTPFYTMEYLQNPQTLYGAVENQALATRVDYIVQILQALAYLHRRNIIHRDLKPANILVMDGVVKVLDFGLAIRTQTAGDEIVGTLSYMAPEVLSGNSASPQSDLYAVGLMAYEMLSGHHPFSTENTTLLISDILEKEADIGALDVPEGVAQVVKRLLAKNPQDRYGSAIEIIEAYNAAVDRTIAYETANTRESFLQAAEFVGRSSEIQQLWEAAEMAIDGHGTTWLIGGESGVGKSRLLDELRVRALVEGMLVLRGQAVAESRSPYFIWRQVLRWIAMMSPLSDLEASILKTVVPDIGSVLSRNVNDAPAIDPQAAQERLLKIVERVFRRQEQPMMILLEDLQWSRDGLEILERLNRLVPHQPIFVAASFRNNEAPDLPQRFPEMTLLQLSPFDENTIALLCETMLGERGKNEALVDIIHRSSEGNVFLLVEAIRELAEESGGLEHIGNITLPRDLLGGGMNIIQRRLDRIPTSALPILKIAALIGKELDLNLLRHIAQDVTYSDWLTTCADAGALVIQDDVWSFAHDKIREALIAEIDATNLGKFHLQIAEGIEAVYPDSTDYYGVLAHHWQKANDTEKAAHYAILAGENAVNNGGHLVAVKFFEMARAMDVGSAFQRAQLEQQLSEAKYGLGLLLAAKDHSEKALHYLGLPLPDGSMAIARLVYGLLQQVGHRIYPQRLSRHGEEARARFLEATRAYQRLSVAHYMRNDTIPTVASTVHALNYAESAGRTPELARASSNFGLAIGLVPPLQKHAVWYLNRALDIAEEHREALYWIRLTRGAFFMGMGEMATSKYELNQAGEVATQDGNQLGIEETQSVLAIHNYHMGMFETGMVSSKTLMDDALAIGAMHNYSSAVVSHSANRLRHGKTAMEEIFPHLESVMAETADLGYQIVGNSTFALSYLQMGEKEKALEKARLVTDIIFNSPATSYYSLIGYIHIAELYLQLVEDGDVSQLDNAKKACKVLQQFADVFPFGKPAANRYNGLLYWLTDNEDKAKKAWQTSIEMAKKYHLLYENARTHIEIARHEPEGHPQRMLHLAEASGLLINLQAPYDLEQVQLMQQTTGHIG